MSDKQRGKPIMIQYIGTRPVRVCTETDDGGWEEWHLTESERDNTTYVEDGDCSGSAGEAIRLYPWADRPKKHPVWIAHGVKTETYLRKARAGETGAEYGSIYGPVTSFAKLGMRRIKEPLAPDPFDGTESLEEYGEESLEYCTVCGPMRGGYYGENLCGHLRWCDGDLCGPGDDEIGTYDDVPAGFKRVVRLIGCARSMRKQLRQHGRAERFISSPTIGCDSIELKIAGRDFSQAANRLHDFDDRDGIREGITWLLGLDAKTKRANKLALAWLDREAAKQNERRSSGRQEYCVVVERYGTKTLAENVSWSEAIRVSAEYKASMQYPDRVRIIHGKHRDGSAAAA